MASLEPGEIVGGTYEIECELGRGGMGIVYRARHTHLDRPVALKVLPDSTASDPEFRERFLRESTVLARLEHPNVVTVYDGGESGGHLYLAMALVSGTDLASLLATSGPLPAERAVAVVGEVAAGLDAAHRQGIIHRDVKTSNIMIEGPLDDVGRPGGDARVLLGDFGLTKSLAGAVDSRSTIQYIGSPAYSSPEQLRGDEVGVASDVYSLGCVLYECLAGHPPFAGATPVAVMKAHLDDDVPPLDGAADALHDVIARAMAKDPRARYGSCGEFVRAARAALSGESVPSARHIPSASLNRESRNPRLGTLLAVLAGVVVAGGAGALVAVFVTSPSGTPARNSSPSSSTAATSPAGPCQLGGAAGSAPGDGGAGGAGPASTLVPSTVAPSATAPPAATAGSVPPSGSIPVAGVASPLTTTAAVSSGASADTAFLGVRIGPSTEDIAGAQIDGLAPSSAILPLCFLSGDVITSLAGQPVSGAASLSAILASHKPGDAVPIVWRRPSSAPAGSTAYHYTITLASPVPGFSGRDCTVAC